MSELAVRAVAVWMGILALAFANGALRETVLVRALGKRTAFAISGLVLTGVVLVVAYLAVPWIDIRAGVQAIGVGVGWVLMTIAFECGLGRARRRSWAEIFKPYRFHDGNLWPLVLLATACGPAIGLALRY